MPRCVVRWRRNPHIERCSPSIFHGYSEVAALGHASFNLARSTRAVKTPNPRRPIAFPCCRRLLYVYSKSFPVFSFSLSRVRLSIPPLFRATLSSLPPPPPRPPRNTELGDLGFLGPVFLLREIVVARLVTKSRELPRILRAAIHGASFALFISFDRALPNLTSIGRLPMRDFGWYPLWFDCYSSWTKASLRQ